MRLSPCRDGGSCGRGSVGPHWRSPSSASISPSHDGPAYRLFAEGSSKMTTTANEPARPVSPTSRPGPVTAADTPYPQVALLSNGAYSIMISNAGAGPSTWRGLDVTRWREDATRDCWGQFVYVRDPEGGRIWSIGHQPLPQAVD